MILIGILAGVTMLLHALGLPAVAAVVLAVLVTGMYYWRDVRRRPRVPCRPCTGSGASRSRLGGAGYFRRPFGNCWCCGGTKAHARLALRVIDHSRYQAIRDEIRRERELI